MDVWLQLSALILTTQSQWWHLSQGKPVCWHVALCIRCWKSPKCICLSWHLLEYFFSPSLTKTAFKNTTDRWEEVHKNIFGCSGSSMNKGFLSLLKCRVAKVCLTTKIIPKTMFDLLILQGSNKAANMLCYSNLQLSHNNDFCVENS